MSQQVRGDRAQPQMNITTIQLGSAPSVSHLTPNSVGCTSSTLLGSIPSLKDTQAFMIQTLSGASHFLQHTLPPYAPGTLGCWQFPKQVKAIQLLAFA